jgi:hypothetical protein
LAGYIAYGLNVVVTELPTAGLGGDCCKVEVRISGGLVDDAGVGNSEVLFTEAIAAAEGLRVADCGFVGRLHDGL